MKIEILINNISSGRINEALDIMLKITKLYDTDFYENVLLLSARYYANERMTNQGTESYEVLKREWNGLVNTLTKYVTTLAETDYFAAIDVENFNEDDNNKAKTKILFVSSSPIGSNKLEFEKEYIEIRKVFKQSRNTFDITELFGTTLDSLLETVRIEKPDILHFSCPSDTNYLYLQRNDNTIRAIPYAYLAPMFILFQPFVKCLFLNTWTSPIFLKRVSNYVKYSVGCTKPLDDIAAILFSTGFYTAIHQGRSYEEAFLLGNEVIKNNPKYRDYSIPYVLFNSGISNNKEDETPDYFDMTEPPELTEYLKKVENKPNIVPGSIESKVGV